ncbi:hypothetical protein RIF29_15859 [Crotalaria pallida]|uniref:Uncharacterized protein n=1 Tax=Crotalaria pallida TaxID=3830 RepID=A0AAN9FG73_CROPI
MIWIYMCLLDYLNKINAFIFNIEAIDDDVGVESETFSWFGSEERWVEEHDDGGCFAREVAAEDEEGGIFLNSNCENLEVTVSKKVEVVEEGEVGVTREVVMEGSGVEEWGVVSILERNKEVDLGLGEAQLQEIDLLLGSQMGSGVNSKNETLFMGVVSKFTGKEIDLCQNEDKGYDIPVHVEACLEREKETIDAALLISLDENEWLGDAALVDLVGGAAGARDAAGALVDLVGGATGARAATDPLLSFDENAWLGDAAPVDLVGGAAGGAGVEAGSCDMVWDGSVKVRSKSKNQKKNRGSMVKKRRKKKCLLPSYFKKKKTRKQNGEVELSMHQEHLDCEGKLVPGDIKSCDNERELEIVLECGNPVEDARRLWEMGKELGVLSVVGDEPVIRKLTLLEMNALGIVVEGEDGGRAKRKEIRKLARSVAAEFVCLQETKLVSADRESCRRIWYDGDDFDFIAFPADGNSGGLLSIWRRSCFTMLRYEVGVGFIIVEGVWGDCVESCCIVNVYGPCNDADRAFLWSTLIQWKSFFFAHYGVWWEILMQFWTVRREKEGVQ